MPAFCTGRGGFRLLAWDEEGEPLTPDQLLAVVAFIEFEHTAAPVAVPPSAPAVLDVLAAGAHSSVLRLGRDGPEAEARYAAAPWLWDALFAACRICAYMGLTGERLRGLAGKIPPFTRCRRDIPLHRDRGAVMQALIRRFPGAEAAGEGLRLRREEGSAYLVPLIRRSALRVVGEAASAELAEELCGFCAQTAQELDRPEPDQQ